MCSGRWESGRLPGVVSRTALRLSTCGDNGDPRGAIGRRAGCPARGRLLLAGLETEPSASNLSTPAAVTTRTLTTSCPRVRGSPGILPLPGTRPHPSALFTSGGFSALALSVHVVQVLEGPCAGAGLPAEALYPNASQCPGQTSEPCTVFPMMTHHIRRHAEARAGCSSRSHGPLCASAPTECMTRLLLHEPTVADLRAAHGGRRGCRRAAETLSGGGPGPGGHPGCACCILTASSLPWLRCARFVFTGTLHILVAYCKVPASLSLPFQTPEAMPGEGGGGGGGLAIVACSLSHPKLKPC